MVQFTNVLAALAHHQYMYASYRAITDGTAVFSVVLVMVRLTTHHLATGGYLVNKVMRAETL
jgi:hypothetical protein